MKRKSVIVATLAFLGAEISNGQFRATRLSEEEIPRAAQFQIEESGQSDKSVLLAVGLSLVLPGMGELYSGNFTSGRYQLAADAALWMTYAGFVFHGHWIRDDARTFAAQHAGADFRGKSETFDVDLGNFATVEEYNLVRLRKREYDRLYAGENDAWRWDSEESRLRFRRLRIRSDEMYQNSKFVIGALVINRLISAFIAARSAGRYNSELTDSWRLKAQADGGLFATYGMKLVLTKEF